MKKLMTVLLSAFLLLSSVPSIMAQEALKDYPTDIKIEETENGDIKITSQDQEYLKAVTHKNLFGDIKYYVELTNKANPSHNSIFQSYGDKFFDRIEYNQSENTVVIKHGAFNTTLPNGEYYVDIFAKGYQNYHLESFNVTKTFDFLKDVSNVEVSQNDTDIIIRATGNDASEFFKRLYKGNVDYDYGVEGFHEEYGSINTSLKKGDYIYNARIVNLKRIGNDGERIDLPIYKVDNNAAYISKKKLAESGFMDGLYNFEIDVLGCYGNKPGAIEIDFGKPFLTELCSSVSINNKIDAFVGQTTDLNDFDFNAKAIINGQEVNANDKVKAIVVDKNTGHETEDNAFIEGKEYALRFTIKTVGYEGIDQTTTLSYDGNKYNMENEEYFGGANGTWMNANTVKIVDIPLTVSSKPVEQPLKLTVDQTNSDVIISVEGKGSQEYIEKLYKGSLADENTNKMTKGNFIGMKFKYDGLTFDGFIENGRNLKTDGTEEFVENLRKVGDKLYISKELLRSKGFYSGEYTFEFYTPTHVSNYIKNVLDGSFDIKLDLNKEFIKTTPTKIVVEGKYNPKYGDSTEIDQSLFKATAIVNGKKVVLTEDKFSVNVKDADKDSLITKDKYFQKGNKYELLMALDYIGSFDENIILEYNGSQYTMEMLGKGGTGGVYAGHMYLYTNASKKAEVPLTVSEKPVEETLKITLSQNDTDVIISAEGKDSKTFIDKLYEGGIADARTGKSTSGKHIRVKFNHEGLAYDGWIENGKNIDKNGKESFVENLRKVGDKLYISKELLRNKDFYSGDYTFEFYTPVQGSNYIGYIDEAKAVINLDLNKEFVKTAPTKVVVESDYKPVYGDSTEVDQNLFKAIATVNGKKVELTNDKFRVYVDDNDDSFPFVKDEYYKEGNEYRLFFDLTYKGHKDDKIVLEFEGKEYTMTQNFKGATGGPYVGDIHLYTTECKKALAPLTVSSKPQEANKVNIPTANKDLVYTGKELVGVKEAEGYTLTNNKATNAGEYVAKATLKEGYKWSDNTTEVKEIKWSISKATPTYTLPTNLKGLEGDKLLTVKLPSGWTWKDDTKLVSATNNIAIYTPTDTKNYLTVEVKLNIELLHEVEIEEGLSLGLSSKVETENNESSSDNTGNAFVTNDGVVESIKDVMTNDKSKTVIEGDANKLINEAIKATKEGKDVKVDVITTLVKEEKKATDIAKDELKEIKALTKDLTIQSYLDLSMKLDVKTNIDNNISESNDSLLRELNEPVELVLKLDLPKDFNAKDYKFYVIAVHKNTDGSLDTTKKEAKLNLKDSTITFETDKFSTYAIAYEKVTPTKPITPSKPSTPSVKPDYIIPNTSTR